MINSLGRVISEFGFLGWVELFAAALVAFGCLGELWIILNKLTKHVEPLANNAHWFWRALARADATIRPVILYLKIKGRKLPEPKEQLLERLFVMMVASGVALELIALVFSLHEFATLNQEAAQARTDAAKAIERSRLAEERTAKTETELTAAKTQLTAAETRLTELQLANLPMDIGEQMSFGAALKPLAGIRVKLRVAMDIKAQRTAELLSSVFAVSGWTVSDRRIVGDIGEEGIIIGHNANEASERAALLLFKHLTERKVPSKIRSPESCRGVVTNEIIVAVMQRPSALMSEIMILMAQDRIETQQRIGSEAKFGLIAERMHVLSKKQFPANSKELADAQTEYNELGSQLEKASKQHDINRNEMLARMTRVTALWKQLENEDSSTNAVTPGIHSYKSILPAGGLPIKVGSNGTFIIHHSNFNTPMLE